MFRTIEAQMNAARMSSNPAAARWSTKIQARAGQILFPLWRSPWN